MSFIVLCCCVTLKSLCIYNVYTQLQCIKYDVHVALAMKTHLLGLQFIIAQLLHIFSSCTALHVYWALIRTLSAIAIVYIGIPPQQRLDGVWLVGLQSHNVEHQKEEKEKMKTKKERGTNYNTCSMTMAYRIVFSHHLQQLRNIESVASTTYMQNNSCMSLNGLCM